MALELSCGGKVSLGFNCCVLEAMLVSNVMADDAYASCALVNDTRDVYFLHLAGLDGDVKDGAGVWLVVKICVFMLSAEVFASANHRYT